MLNRIGEENLYRFIIDEFKKTYELVDFLDQQQKIRKLNHFARIEYGIDSEKKGWSDFLGM